MINAREKVFSFIRVASVGETLAMTHERLIAWLRVKKLIESKIAIPESETLDDHGPGFDTGLRGIRDAP